MNTTIDHKRKVVKVSVLSFLRKFGETEDPLFKDLPVETPPPDEGQAEELQKTQNLATWEDEKYG